jgi:hypothetical protein
MISSSIRFFAGENSIVIVFFGAKAYLVFGVASARERVEILGKPERY